MYRPRPWRRRESRRGRAPLEFRCKRQTAFGDFLVRKTPISTRQRRNHQSSHHNAANYNTRCSLGRRLRPARRVPVHHTGELPRWEAGAALPCDRRKGLAAQGPAVEPAHLPTRCARLRGRLGRHDLTRRDRAVHQLAVSGLPSTAVQVVFSSSKLTSPAGILQSSTPRSAEASRSRTLQLRSMLCSTRPNHQPEQLTARPIRPLVSCYSWIYLTVAPMMRPSIPYSSL